MRLTINLATKTYLNRSQLNLAFSIVFVLLTLFLALNIRNIASNYGEESRVSKELKTLEQKSGIKGRTVPEPEYKNLVQQISFANGVIYRKTFSWIGLLEKFENVVPDGIALTHIEPDSKGKALKLAGTTASFARLRQLLENMESSKDFSDIYLLTQADAKVGETQKGISFSITCQVKM
jgi:type IV pilus assembly protein PilN